MDSCWIHLQDGLIKWNLVVVQTRLVLAQMVTYINANTHKHWVGNNKWICIPNEERSYPSYDSVACYLVMLTFLMIIALIRKRWPSDKPIIFLWGLLTSKNLMLDIAVYSKERTMRAYFWSTLYLFTCSYCYYCINLGHCLILVILVAVLLDHATFCNEVIFVHHTRWNAWHCGASLVSWYVAQAVFNLF